MSFTIEEANKRFSIPTASLPPERERERERERARAIGQNEAGIAYHNSRFPILGTYGAGPCIIIAAWNPQTKQAFLAHADSLSDIGSINYHLNKIKTTEPLELYLLGGNEDTRGQARFLLALYEKFNGIEIKGVDLCSPSAFGSKSFALNARTGEVYTDLDWRELAEDPKTQDRQKQLAVLPITRPVHLTSENDIPADPNPNTPNSFPSQTFEKHNKV